MIGRPASRSNSAGLAAGPGFLSCFVGVEAVRAAERGDCLDAGRAPPLDARSMANEREDTKRPTPQSGTVSVAAFRADASGALREARARGIVTVTEPDGRPRMHIVRQTDSLDD